MEIFLVHTNSWPPTTKLVGRLVVITHRSLNNRLSAQEPKPPSIKIIYPVLPPSTRMDSTSLTLAAQRVEGDQAITTTIGAARQLRWPKVLKAFVTADPMIADPVRKPCSSKVGLLAVLYPVRPTIRHLLNYNHLGNICRSACFYPVSTRSYELTACTLGCSTGLIFKHTMPCMHTYTHNQHQPWDAM